MYIHQDTSLQVNVRNSSFKRRWVYVSGKRTPPLYSELMSTLENMREMYTN